MKNENSQQNEAKASEVQEAQTKTAETRLKEMSRKAKQKGKRSVPKPKIKSLPMLNPNWVCIGIGLAGIAGITYLIHRGQSENPPLQVEPSSDEKSKLGERVEASAGQSDSVSVSTRHEGTRHEGMRHQGPVKPSFKLNSF